MLNKTETKADSINHISSAQILSIGFAMTYVKHEIHTQKAIQTDAMSEVTLRVISEHKTDMMAPVSLLSQGPREYCLPGL